MDHKELDTNINEIEDRLERVRSLYEQYFCGIEKVEPQVPRKDLERRIAIMRKEQIRNTAMRFKFQTLIQRYNTMQQHWGRILREIENGTYKRDLARAAARFGVDDALTAVGRKRAERLAQGLKAQLDRDEYKKALIRKMTGADDEYEEVAPDDVQSEDDFDDDAPTPPPVSRQPQAEAWGQPGQGEPDPYLEQTYAPSAEVAPQPQAKVPVRGVGFFSNMRAQQQPSAGGPRAPAPQPEKDEPWAPPIAGRSPAPAIPSMDIEVPASWPPPAQNRPDAGPASSGPASASGAPKAKGGLRLGGGGARRVNQEALNRIASTLGDDVAPVPGAAPVRRDGPVEIAPAPPPVVEAPKARRPLLSNPLDLELPPVPPDARIPTPEPTRPVAVPPSAFKSALTPPTRPEPLKPAPAPAPAAAPAPAPSGEGERSAAVGLRPPNKPGPNPLKPAAKKPGDENLSSDRLREIYSQYVQSRRDRNESTAGITFDKLADSLRSQADKLREKHAAKKIDYEVVVKDGKTLIKPIVR